MYVDIKDSAEKLQSRAAELTGDAGKQQRIRDKAAQVMQAVNEASNGWIEGKGEAGHIGIYVHQMQSADAETGVHDAAYVRGSGEADQCTMVKTSEWWVVQSSKDRSVLDKIFYQVKFRVLVKEENQGEAIVEHHQYGGIRMLKYYRKSA